MQSTGTTTLNCILLKFRPLNVENRLHGTKYFYLAIFVRRIIESMMGLRPRQGNLRLVFRLFSLMRGLPSIRLK